MLCRIGLEVGQRQLTDLQLTNLELGMRAMTERIGRKQREFQEEDEEKEMKIGVEGKVVRIKKEPEYE
jgi:hypothetical protein